MQRGGKKKQLRGMTGVRGRQLEATVHTSLPPRVEGSLRAYMRVSISTITWEYSIGPPAPKLCVGLKWWGEESPGTIFRVPVVQGQKKWSGGESTTLAFFPIRSALPQLKAYLRDMKSLKLRVGLGHMTEDSMVIGHCTLTGLSRLTESQSYKNSLPIIGTQGHRLGTLHVQVELQVARAGQTHLVTSGVATDLSSPPEFKVGPGAIEREKQRELEKKDMDQKLLAQDSSANAKLSLSLAPVEKSLQSESAASHKAALLAKYIHPHTEPGRAFIQESKTTVEESGNEVRHSGIAGQAVPLGPRQQEVLAELIERGERLREAMVRAVLDSKKEGELNEKEWGRDPEKKGVKQTKRVGRSVLGGCEDVYSSEEEKEGGVVSSEESDYPLHNPSLLEKLLYRGSVKVANKANDCGTQTLTISDHPGSRTSAEIHSSPPPPPHIPPSPSSPGSPGAPPGGSSLSTLASFFSDQSVHKSTDAEILQALGVERLTLLGRVTACRVVVESLEVELAALLAHRSRPHHSKSFSNTQHGTFFVEYHFPAPVGRAGKWRETGSRKRLFPPPHEVVRVASRKIKDKVVNFGHRSVFPVSLSGSAARQWWHDILVFTVYYRHPSDRAPFLLGKAKVPFRQWLMAGASSHAEAAVTSSVVGQREGGGEENSTNKDTVGKLAVCLQLLCGKGDGQKTLSESESAVRTASEPGRDRATEVNRERGKESNTPSPIRLKEKYTVSANAEIDKQPKPLQLLLMIPEGTHLSLPPTKHSSPSPSAREVVPNCYLVCRLFCARPHPKTHTVWASSNPHFNFKQVVPLYLTPSLLEQVCNNFTVVEVWHKTPGVNTTDELLGLVKLSLHQFYLAFSEESSASLCLHAQLPVVAVDSYCPVVSPFTGKEQGSLAVLLAMGSPQQVMEIQQQFAAGAYKLHRPFNNTTQPVQPQAPVMQQVQIGGLKTENEGTGPTHHTFTVTVSGVRGLSVFSSTVWGEADCFVQYHFPSVSDKPPGGREREEGGLLPVPEVALEPVRTNLTLCVPNPTFSHEVSHSLSLPPDCLVQREMMRACGNSGGVVFELWRRFYYPNIRDHLIAKATLPVAKLCALVSMQRMAGPTVQSFSLPMTLVDKEMQQGGSGGILEVTVQYQALGENGKPQLLQSAVVGISQGQQSHVTLTVEVVRATGLKDAAVQAAQDQPVPLGFAAEVGINCYARVSLPGLLEKEARRTKTIMRTFSPDFSHSLEFALPLVSQQSAHSMAVSLAQRLAEGTAVVEVWHKVPTSDSWGAGSVGGAVCGRRLGPAIRDVCLGQAVLPLIQLLQKQSGVCGWLPLYPPAKNSNIAAPELITNHSSAEYVGGIEVSLSFSSDEERELVLSHGQELGWVPANTDRVAVGGAVQREGVKGEGKRELKDAKCRWKFSIEVMEISVPVEAVTILLSQDPAPYMYCYLKYRFFDSDVVLTQPRSLSYCCDGRACYQLRHHAKATTSGSHDLLWYVGEELLEVEVWSCPNRRRPERETDCHHSEEGVCGETLLGTAFLSLREVLSGECISGSYPMFKVGEASLGNQLLTVQIKKTVTDDSHTQTSESQPTLLEILDDSGDREVDFVPLKPVSEGEEEREGRGVSVKRDVLPEEVSREFEDMFEARLVIHEALHLPMVTDKAQEKEWPPSAYVTLHPHPKVDKIATSAVPSTQTPNWSHHCLTHIPNLYLDTHCPGLELQVWSKATVDDETAKPLADSSAQPGGCEGDIYIGCVQVDLSVLAMGLPQISGWYNISDFGGQIQGQLKVTVVPCRGWNHQPNISHSLPLSHVLVSIHSVMTPHLSGDLLAWSSSHSQPVPSFMEKSSSILLQKLRDNLNELDQISASLKTNPGATDVMDHSSQVLAALPAIPTVPSSGISTTTQVSVSLEYSSSGPSLEQHTLPTVEGVGESLKVLEVERDKPAVVVATTEHGASNSLPSPQKCLTAPQTEEDEISHTPALSLIDSCSPSLSEDTHSRPLALSDEEAPSTCGATYTVPSSGTHTFDTAAQSPASVGSGNRSLVATDSERNSQLTDISSSSDGEELAIPLPSVAVPSPSGAQDRETTTVTPTSSCLVLEGREQKETEGDCDQVEEEGNTGSGDDEVVEKSDVKTHVMEGSGEPGLISATNDAKPCDWPPITQLQQQPPLKMSSVPEVCLPNFFMPPLELEQAMRSLRASALARPPPASLFDHHSTQHHLQEKATTAPSHRVQTSHSSSIKTLQDVDQFLRSRRQTTSNSRGSSSDCQTLADRDAQRLSKIFSSKPLQTSSKT